MKKSTYRNAKLIIKQRMKYWIKIKKTLITWKSRLTNTNLLLCQDKKNFKIIIRIIINLMNQLWMKLIVFKKNNINNSNSNKVKSQTTILIIQIITYNLQILLLNLWKGILLRIIRVFPTRLEGHQKHLILKFQIIKGNDTI